MKISGLWKRPFVAPVRIHPPLKFFTPHLLPASFFCPFPAWKNFPALETPNPLICLIIEFNG
jgi:hypothetical protein